MINLNICFLLCICSVSKYTQIISKNSFLLSYSIRVFFLFFFFLFYFFFFTEMILVNILWLMQIIVTFSAIKSRINVFENLHSILFFAELSSREQGPNHQNSTKLPSHQSFLPLSDCCGAGRRQYAINEIAYGR